MICKNCSRNFEIDNDDISVYRKFDVPEPTMCTDCRQQRRMAWRNERVLYKRKCDLCKKDLISNHHSDVPFPVYCSECWWSDKRDTVKYAQDFDFSKPFFQQFELLLNKVPRINLSASNNENCDYVNYTNYSKDCYLVYGGHHSEKCFYCWRVHDSIGCFDCGQCNNCQYSYECMDCDNCYKLVFAQMCQNCDNSYYLYNCKSCSECFMCCNLIHKKHCIFNEQYSREDYERRTKELLGMRETLQQKFQELKLKYPHKALNIVNCKDCTGDYLINCDNCKNTYSGKECKDCSNSYMNERAHDCTDGDMVGWPAELCYESISTAVNAFMNLFSSVCWTCNNIYYCDLCFNSGNLFGCVGLNRKNFCILNKQYSEDEYKNMIVKITAHMIQTGEYGEFFPINISPFAYNETIALENYPMTKEEALNKGYKWKESQEKFNTHNPDTEICIKCNKSFKILNSEKDFYKNLSVQIPRECPNCRHQYRIALRNPRHLYDRTCAKCGNAMQTTYAPDRPEIVYCEKCYLNMAY